VWVLVKEADGNNSIFLRSGTSAAGKRDREYTLFMVRKHDERGDAPRPPTEAHDTVRHLIMTELEQGPHSARDLSGLVGIPEKEVAGHLDHIRQSLHRTGRRLIVQPAECAKCGFVFEKRERLTRPSRCPVCKSESLHAPLFSLASP
jgi:predicted Zn-ribbon and HTH transcriptional regulator